MFPYPVCAEARSRVPPNRIELPAPPFISKGPRSMLSALSSSQQMPRARDGICLDILQPLRFSKCSTNGSGLMVTTFLWLVYIKISNPRSPKLRRIHVNLHPAGHSDSECSIVECPVHFSRGNPNVQRPKTCRREFCVCPPAASTL